MDQVTDVAEGFAGGAQFIGGEPRGGGGGERCSVVDPASGRVVWTCETAGPRDVDAAVRAEKEALPGWAGATPGERGEALHRLAGKLGEQALANDTPYGLAASAWTRDVYRAGRAGREIAAGCVWINDHIPIISEMPHGGWKSSGYGKDMSSYSFEEYTQVKHVMYDNTAVVRKDWHRTVFGDR